MAISAPLNGAGVGEVFNLNFASTADPRVLSFTPNVGDVLFVHNSTNNTQRFTSIVQTGVTWTRLYITVNLTATYHVLEYWMGVVSSASSSNITFNGLTAFNVGSTRTQITQHTGLTTPTLQIGCVNAEGGVTLIKSANILPVSGSDVIVFAVGIALAGTIGAPSSGYTALTSGSTATGFAYKLINASAAVTNTSWTCTSGGTQSLIIIVSNTGPVSTTAKDSNTDLIATVGGNSVLPIAYDKRVGVSDVGGLVTDWADACLSNSSRPIAPGLFNLTAVNRPTFTGTSGSGGGVISTLAASLQYLVTGQDSRLVLDGVVAGAGDIYIIACAKATGNGPVFGMASNPVSLLYPFMYVNPQGGNWKADLASVGAGDRIAPNSGVAWNDGAHRGTIVGKDSFKAFSNADGIYKYLFPGRTGRRHHIVTSPATTVAGGLRLGMGRFDTAYGTAEYDWLGVHFGPLNLAQRQAYQSFFFAQFGATADSSRFKTFIVNGSSIPRGSGSTTPVIAAVGSGTTSYPYLLINDATGKGTFVAQGIVDDTEVHSYNMGIGGWNLTQIKANYQTDTQVNFDRPGAKVMLSDEIGNEIQRVSTGSTAAAVLQLIKDITDLCHADGIRHYTCTVQDRSAGNDGSGSTLFGWYSSLGGPLGVYGAVAMAVNLALVTNPSAYCDGVIDVAANSVFAINRGGSHASEDGTYYVVGGDYTHQKDAGYVVKEGIIKAWFETNNAFSIGNSNLRTYLSNRRRRY